LHGTLILPVHYRWCDSFFRWLPPGCRKAPARRRHPVDTHYRNMAGSETNSFGSPLFLESFERDGGVRANAYRIFDYPFSSVFSALKVPANIS